MSKPPDRKSEAELFRAAMRDVRRLRNNARAPEQPKPPAQARFTRADEREVLRESLLPVGDPAALETGDELMFRRPGIPDTVLRKLRRGQYAVDAELDLHGMTTTEARAVLRAFVADAVQARMRCIRVIHGKGRGSGPRGPVLKNMVNVWLRQVEAVIAFGSPPPIHGGSGAVYVLLKANA